MHVDEPGHEQKLAQVDNAISGAAIHPAATSHGGYTVGLDGNRAIDKYVPAGEQNPFRVINRGHLPKNTIGRNDFDF